MVKRKRVSRLEETAQDGDGGGLLDVPFDTTNSNNATPTAALAAHRPIAQPNRDMPPPLLLPTTHSRDPSISSSSAPTSSSSSSSPSSSSPGVQQTTLEDELAKVVICPICLGPFEERVYLSPCFHSYCATCLDAWVAVSVSCPLCKTRPDKLHYGVDTTRRLLQTIYIAQSRSAATTAVVDSSTPLSWRDQLHRLAMVQGQLKPSWSSSTSTDADDKATRVATCVSDDEDEEMQEDYFITTTTGTATQKSRSPTPIDSSAFEYDTQPFFLSTKQPLTTTATTEGGSALPLIPSSSSSSSATATAATIAAPLSQSEQGKVLGPCRMSVYVYHLVPYPAACYPKAEQIYERDLPLLRPFLERDLAILTETLPRPSELVQSHVESLLCSVIATGAAKTWSPKSQQQHQRQQHRRLQLHPTLATPPPTDTEAQWQQVVCQIAEWITFSITPSYTSSSSSQSQLPPAAHLLHHQQASPFPCGSGAVVPRTSLELAQQFVDEMRQIVYRRLALRPWDAQVLYGRAS